MIQDLKCRSGSLYCAAMLFVLLVGSIAIAGSFSQACVFDGRTQPFCLMKYQERDTERNYRTQSLPSSHHISVPYYEQQTSYWCGPASLQMLFDYYGPNIRQIDIARVAGTQSWGTNHLDLVRASYFSCLSTDVTTEQLHGYAERSFGYPTYTHQWAGSLSAIGASVKNLLCQDIPLLVATWYSSSHSAGHYRVITGYNDTTNTFLIHDPWYTPPYQGPDLPINQGLFLSDLWTLSGYWGMIIQPWNLTVSVNPTPVTAGGSTTISAVVTAPCPEPFTLDEFPVSHANATLQLPPGFTFTEGLSCSPFNFTEGVASVTWVVRNPLTLTSSSVAVNVTVCGMVSSYGAVNHVYTDIVGTEASLNVYAIPGTAPLDTILADPKFLRILVGITICVIVALVIIVIWVKHKKH
ncbi:MAG: C39 family peptidase [Promethearchaeota archaeon]